MNNFTSKTHLHTILLVITISISLIIIALVAAVLGVVMNQRKNSDRNEIISTTTPLSSVTSIYSTPTSTAIVTKNLSDTINSTQLMFHLEQLQAIADNNDRTRTLGTSGFKATLEYIETQLRSKTNFQIFRQEFFVPVTVTSNPVLTSTIGGVDKNYTYDIDFLERFSSPAANFLTPIRLTIVPNFGCDDDDWQHATPHPATDSVILVMHSENCSLAEKSIVAEKYNISGLLVYISDINVTDLPFLVTRRNITYPVIVLSYELGAQLVEATRNHLVTNASVRIFITPGNSITEPISSENLCADTLTGNKTQTIIIGSHSDSIKNTSGINDNGSGAMATLVLAINLAHLFQISSYEKYLYRIRFCWWGAEENGLLGSYHHLEEANLTTIEGNRLKDYVLMLNFDMLASPNYYFGIYESDSLPDVVLSTVKNASTKISQLFRNWFEKEKLPWDNNIILSDHVPFLVAGVPCGGICSGIDGIKTVEQRNRYDRMLGHGHGGIVGAPFDPCYHEACDTIENTNPFVYETMVKSAAYALETFARIPDLHLWLYT